MPTPRIVAAGFLLAGAASWLSVGVSLQTSAAADDAQYTVTEDDDQIRIETDALEAVIRKRGYVSGVADGTFVDKKTGFRDAGFGLDIVDWIMEPGSDEDYRDQLPDHMVYQFNNAYHGRRAKRSIEGPQICTKAGEVETEIIRGGDFLAVKLRYRYHLAAPERKTGSLWTQTLVFPVGKRYFISSDRIDAVNSSPAMFLRVDMPGHIKHNRGDTFSEIYLSYHGRIPAEEFFDDFAPDEKFHYLREKREAEGELPKRIIRAYKLRDAESDGNGRDGRNGRHGAEDDNRREGPWLAGMTLDPSAVYEAWCHQRGYVCMIEEFGGRPVKAGESFSAAFVVGYFDSIDEMNEVYDQYRDHNGLEVTERDWKLVP